MECIVEKAGPQLHFLLLPLWMPNLLSLPRTSIGFILFKTTESSLNSGAMLYIYGVGHEPSSVKSKSYFYTLYLRSKTKNQ